MNKKAEMWATVAKLILILAFAGLLFLLATRLLSGL